MLISNQGRRTLLGRLLNTAIPLSWPPPFLDKETLAEFARIQSEGSDQNFCSWYRIRCGDERSDRTLIGSGGIASVQGEPDTVMIGYSVLGAYWNQGYATEAVRHLVPVILDTPGIRRITATTYPEMTVSIRVLEKNGFIRAGIGRWRKRQGGRYGTVFSHQAVKNQESRSIETHNKRTGQVSRRKNGFFYPTHAIQS